MWTVLLTAALFMAPSQTPAETAKPAEAPQAAAAPAAPLPRDEKLPPSEEQAKAALEKSPRHGEYVDVKLPGGGAPIRTWVVYPERKEKAGVVIVIHEIFGLSDCAAELILKRGYASDNEFFNWCVKSFNRSQVERRNVTVTLIAQGTRTNVFAWTFVGAYPVKWSGPSFKAGENNIAIETLELAHQGMQIT